MAVEKLSISVPAELARKVRQHAGPQGVSAFATKSLQRQLEEEDRRHALDEYLDEMDELYGPVDEARVEEARKLFRD